MHVTRQQSASSSDGSIRFNQEKITPIPTQQQLNQKEEKFTIKHTYTHSNNNTLDDREAGCAYYI